MFCALGVTALILLSRIQLYRSVMNVNNTSLKKTAVIAQIQDVQANHTRPPTLMSMAALPKRDTVLCSIFTHLILNTPIFLKHRL